MFLTTDELKRLTGFSKPSRQLRWLRDNGWKHTVDGHGDPIVAVEEQRRQLVGGTASKVRREPNWEELNGKAS